MLKMPIDAELTSMMRRCPWASSAAGKSTIRLAPFAVRGGACSAVANARMTGSACDIFQPVKLGSIVEQNPPARRISQLSRQHALGVVEIPMRKIAGKTKRALGVDH